MSTVQPSATSRRLDADEHAQLLVDLREGLCDDPTMAECRRATEAMKVAYELLACASAEGLSPAAGGSPVTFARSETAPLVAGDLAKQREIHDSYAPWRAGEEESELRTAALNAVNKLETLGRTFSGPHFTDRYGDGPACLELAKRLKEAING